MEKGNHKNHKILPKMWTIGCFCTQVNLVLMGVEHNRCRSTFDFNYLLYKRTGLSGDDFNP